MENLHYVANISKENNCPLTLFLHTHTQYVTELYLLQCYYLLRGEISLEIQEESVYQPSGEKKICGKLGFKFTSFWTLLSWV